MAPERLTTSTTLARKLRKMAYQHCASTRKPWRSRASAVYASFPRRTHRRRGWVATNEQTTKRPIARDEMTRSTPRQRQWGFMSDRDTTHTKLTALPERLEMRKQAAKATRARAEERAQRREERSGERDAKIARRAEREAESLCSAGFYSPPAQRAPVLRCCLRFVSAGTQLRTSRAPRSVPRLFADPPSPFSLPPRRSSVTACARSLCHHENKSSVFFEEPIVLVGLMIQEPLLLLCCVVVCFVVVCLLWPSIDR